MKKKPANRFAPKPKADKITRFDISDAIGKKLEEISLRNSEKQADRTGSLALFRERK